MGWKCAKFNPDVARPILAPESRFWGIRWRDRHHFSRYIFSDESRVSKSAFSKNCPRCPGSPKWSRKEIVYTSGDQIVAAKNCSNFWGEKTVQTSGAQIRPRWPRMLRGRFWLENQDCGASVGAIGIIFRDTSFPTSPGSQNRLFRKIAPGVQGRRHGRGKKLFTLLGTKCE